MPYIEIWRYHLATEVARFDADFFLWSYLKSKVYINRLQSLTALKVDIQEEIANISAETLCHVMKSA